MDDDDYYGPRFTVFDILLERGSSLLIPLGIAMIVFPLVFYGYARARQAREPFPDPQFGVKFALSYFKLVAYHVLLLGGVLLAFSILMKSKEKAAVYRPAFGLVVPAAMVYATQVWALFRTNQEEAPLVPRLMGGWSVMISGVFGFIGLIAVSQAIFKKGEAGEIGRFSWALFLVYGSAWVVQTVRYYRSAWSVTLGNEMAPYYPPPPGAYPDPSAGAALAAMPYPGDVGAPPPPAGAPGLPSPFTAPSPFAPPHPGYAPPASSPFAPPSPPDPSAPPPPAPAGSPFAPPPTTPSPFAPGAPPPGPSPFAPPGSGPVPTPAPSGGSVPIPAPMAQPLKPSGGGSGSSGSNPPR